MTFSFVGQGIGVYPGDDDLPTTVRLIARGDETSARKLGWLGVRHLRSRVVATGIAAVVLAVGAAAGERAAVDYIVGAPDPDTAPIGARDPGAPPGGDHNPGPAASGDHNPGTAPIQDPGTAPGGDDDPGTAAGTGSGSSASSPAGKNAEARRLWARQYGRNRAAMPNLPDVASASPGQRQSATDLLTRTRVSTAAYANTGAAQAAGYDFADSLARAKNNPRVSRWLSRIDAGVTPPRPVVLRVVNKTFVHDGKVLDPAAPQALIYTYQGHNTWKLVGATFGAGGSYPGAPPDPGGPITRWRYGVKYPATLTMDVYFVAADDLAHAWALNPPGK